MFRLALPLALLAAVAALPAAAGPKPPSGDAVVRGRAGPSDIVITTTSRLAGAIHSVRWGGKEFIDSFDHGRQLQSACSFGDGFRDYWAEAYNPTEAGSRRDGAGPRSTSQLVGLTASGRVLASVNRMAFWLAPGEQSEGRPARNAGLVSDVLLTKQVAVGYKKFAHAIDYRVTFTVPPTERQRVAQFEALTGYMPADFSKFWTVDPATGKTTPLTDGPGEQPLPVMFTTANGLYAMGVYSPDRLPGRAARSGFERPGYGRFRFPEANVVKWNCTFRLDDPAGVKPGNYTFQLFVAVGTADNVRDTLVGLAGEFR